MTVYCVAKLASLQNLIHFFLYRAPMCGALFILTNDVGSDMHAHAHMHTYTHSARVTSIVSCLNASSLTNLLRSQGIVHPRHFCTTFWKSR